jgi:hypothetical protein
MTKILGFAGKKYSGKTSAANFLVGTFLANIVQTETNESIIPYFKLDDRGRLIVPTNLEPKMVFNTNISQWEPSESLSEGILDVKGRQNDTTWLVENLWPYVKVYSFADILKQIINGLLDIDDEYLNGSKKEHSTKVRADILPIPREKLGNKAYLKKTGYLTAREIAQYLGTDILRTINPNCFVDYTLKQIGIEAPMYAIIDDCRFENEVKGILEHGGLVYGLERNIDKQELATHVSETLDDAFNICTRRINNNNLTMIEKNEIVMQFLTKDNFFEVT